MSVPWHTSAGDEGEAVAMEGEFLRVISPKAFAPGQPLSFAVGMLQLQGKSRGSKRREDGRFDVTLRLTNLRAEERSALRGLLNNQLGN